MDFKIKKSAGAVTPNGLGKKIFIEHYTIVLQKEELWYEQTYDGYRLLELESEVLLCEN